jgi:hypothetical protein
MDGIEFSKKRLDLISDFIEKYELEDEAKIKFLLEGFTDEFNNSTRITISAVKSMHGALIIPKGAEDVAMKVDICISDFSALCMIYIIPAGSPLKSILEIRHRIDSLMISFARMLSAKAKLLNDLT